MIREKTELIRTALYIRVSTDRQAKEGDSLEAQESALRKYAKENNHIIVDAYIDGGESGQKFNRTNFQRMLSDVRNGKIDLIIMTKLDRWFRNPADFYKTVEILQKNKVNWKTIWEDYDTTTASGEFWLNMSLSMARMEAKRTGERISSVFDHKYSVQKTVCTGMMPYGYSISPNKKVAVDPVKSQNIIALYNHYIETNKLLETVKWFQNNCDNKSFSSIKLYLKNTAYIGKFLRKKTGTIIEDYCPRILDDETFYEVQRLLSKNIKVKKEGHNKTYIFSGMLKCSECGGKYTGRYSNLTQNHYYRCKKAIESVYCENTYNIPEKMIENFLINNIKDILHNKIIEINEVSQKQEVDKDNIQTLRAKLEKLIELFTNNLIDIDNYKERYESINKEIQIEEKKKSQEKKKIDFLKIKKLLTDDFLSTYDILSNEEKRRIWVSIIDSIEIKGKEINKISFTVHDTN